MKELEPLKPVSLPCYDFINDGEIKYKVSAIIAPITIDEEGNTRKIGYACSKALSCQNETCRYSKASRQEG